MPFPSTITLPRLVVATATSVPPAGADDGADDGAGIAVEHPARISANNAAPVRPRVSFVFTMRSFNKGASADAELGRAKMGRYLLNEAGAAGVHSRFIAAGIR